MASRRVGFTCGTFDLLHAGHIMMLRDAKAVCGHLIVGLQSDPTVDRPEKNKPIQTLEERKIQLEAVRYVDQVLTYTTEQELEEMLWGIMPDIRIIGADWMDKEYTGKGMEGIDVYFNTRDHSYSSTELRERIKASM